MQPHGNSKSDIELQRPYIRTSKKVLLQQSKMAMSRKSVADIYSTQIKQSNPFTSKTQSEEPRNMKQIRNRLNLIRKEQISSQSQDGQVRDELSRLLIEQQNSDVIKTISVSKSAYFVFLYTSRQMNDITKFCCSEINATTLSVDTTFNLWVADTTYRNKRLINPETKKHPVFLGPAMFHFTKDEDAFARFALEFLQADYRIKTLKQIGVDMESAIFNGFRCHFPDLGRLLCVRHISKRDESKLAKLLFNSKQNACERNKSKSEILKDIYGHRSGNWYEYGLAEATDKTDFEEKLSSLFEKWESLCHDFHGWFLKKRSAEFTTSIIKTAREGTDVIGNF